VGVGVGERDACGGYRLRMKNDSSVAGQDSVDRDSRLEEPSGTPKPGRGSRRAVRRRDAGKVLPTILVLNAMVGAAGIIVAARPDAMSVSMTLEPVSVPDGGVGAAPLPVPDDPTAPGPIVRLGTFIVQMRTAEGEQHARVTLDVEIAEESDRNPLLRHMPQIHDMMIRYYSDRMVDELRGSRGIERAKADLLRRIGELVGGGRVRNLFVIDFVIQ
jgi:flagellar FliL protein